jgi:hypothetical protein
MGLKESIATASPSLRPQAEGCSAVSIPAVRQANDLMSWGLDVHLIVAPRFGPIEEYRQSELR